VTVISETKAGVHIPGEWEPHSRCLMAWAVHKEWGKSTAEVKRELADLIRTISRFEPVALLTPPGNSAEARDLFDGHGVEIIEAPVDDIWMRDVAPTFVVLSDGTLGAIDWNFNSWGKTRTPRPGDMAAEPITDLFKARRLSPAFVAEGGAFAFDGNGTAITTRSCLLNDNRNPVGFTADRQAHIEAELKKVGVRQVIWLEGDPSEPVTSGHVDGYVLCAPDNVILVESIEDPDPKVGPPFWREHDIDLLSRARDADGRPYKVMRVAAPRSKFWASGSKYFAPCYLNAFISDKAVIIPRFGDDERDAAAREAFTEAFPGRVVEMISIDHIAAGGGGIHCLTQPIPLI